MSRIRTLATWIAFAGLVIPGAAGALICDTLGSAASRWDLVTQDKVVTKRRVPYYSYYYYGCNSWGFTGEDFASCSASARYFHSSLDSITATRSTGTALRFKDGGEHECGSSSNVFEIFTGGGRARLSGLLNPDTIDTTGTQPAVAACDDAIAQMSAASAAFAAMPAVRTFGKVRIERGEELVIDATGGGVIDIEQLIMAAVPAGPYNGYRVGTCIYDADIDGNATLRIEGNFTDEVVLNVGHLDVGGCAEIYSDPLLLINVPGPGRKVRIGISAFYSSAFPPDLLAPERTVRVVGGRTEEATAIAGVYARKLVSLGYVYNVEPLCKTCGNGVVDAHEACDGNGCAAGTYCDETCSCSTRCGDGIIAGSEVCDGADGCMAGEGCNGQCSACEPCPPAAVIPAEGGTFQGRTGGRSLLASCDGFESPERTFEWTPAASGTATISLCGSSYDTVLYVREGGCGGTELACNDDFCSFQSRVAPVVTAGQTYTIVVDGWSGESGAFVLTVTPPTP